MCVLYVCQHMNTRTRHPVRLEVAGEPVDGEVAVPADASGIVVFAAGTSGTRYGTLERQVTGRLHELGVATLVVDLLSHREAAKRSLRSDVDLLTRRLGAQIDWLDAQEATASLDVAICGVDTGAAAAVQFLADTSRDVAGLAVLNGWLDPVTSSVSDLRHPLLFVLEEEYGHLESTTRTAYERASVSDDHKHFLHVTDHDALGLVARWFDVRLHHPTRTAPRLH